MRPVKLMVPWPTVTVGLFVEPEYVVNVSVAGPDDVITVLARFASEPWKPFSVKTAGPPDVTVVFANVVALPARPVKVNTPAPPLIVVPDEAREPP